MKYAGGIYWMVPDQYEWVREQAKAGAPWALLYLPWCLPLPQGETPPSNVVAFPGKRVDATKERAQS